MRRSSMNQSVKSQRSHRMKGDLPHRWLPHSACGREHDHSPLGKFSLSLVAGHLGADEGGDEDNTISQSERVSDAHVQQPDSPSASAFSTAATIRECDARASRLAATKSIEALRQQLVELRSLSIRSVNSTGFYCQRKLKNAQIKSEPSHQY